MQQIVLSRTYSQNEDEKLFRQVECVGRSFIRSLVLKNYGTSASSLNKENTRNEDSNIVFEDDVEYLRSLNPKEWKEQDHYAVLGIKNLRFEATDDDIKRAYRHKVLRHHPDKRKAQGEEIRSEDDYFTCITKAYEILGTPSKRRSYDSVDPKFDDSLPSGSDLKKKFYDMFGPYFISNSRWSEKKNIPFLGNDDSSRSDVEKFYNFWYAFESWREFSYDDEEEKEKGQDREERRWIEKQNKVVRAKKKKEEMTRIRSLVDLAYNNDPRIVRFKQDDKDKKLALKKARQDAAQARKAEEEKQIREAQFAKEVAEKEEKARMENIRAEKEMVKKILKKERKTFRDICKSNNYFINEECETIDHMSAVEKICEVLKLLELQELNKTLSISGRETFLNIMNETEKKLENERKAQYEIQKNDVTKPNSSKNIISAGPPPWTPDLTHLLIKSVNFFPAGTNQRWEVIANFVNQHGVFEDHRRFTAKDILNKAKDLQSSDFSKNSLKTAVNQEAFDKFEKEKKKGVSVINDCSISKSFDSTKTFVNGSSIDTKPMKSDQISNLDNGPKKKVDRIEDKKDDLPWTKIEQELLEQAIKTYPASTPERWDRIAECIPNRSKKDCMRRFKELVDLVKAKKAAAQVNK